MPRRLMPDEAAALGLPAPPAPPRRLSAQQAQEIGLPTPTTPAPPPDMSGFWGGVETVGNSGVGKLPGGNLVSNLILTALADGLSRGGERATLTPQAKEALKSMGVETPEEPGIVDRYRTIRDTRKVRTAAGEEQNPGLATAGKVLGVGSTLFLPGPKVGAVRGIPNAAIAEKVGRILSAGASGATYGAANAALDGSADLTKGEIGKAAEETVSGALGGGALGLGVGVGGELLRPLAGALKAKALGLGRRIIHGGSVLKGDKSGPVSDEVVDEVMGSGLMRPFSSTQKTYERIAKAAGDQGAEYGRILAALEANGVQGPRARELADEILSGADDAFQGRMAGDASSRVLEREGHKIEALARGATRTAKNPQGPMRERLPLAKAEELKRNAQQMGHYERMKASPTQEAYQKVGGAIRSGIEDSVNQAGQTAAPGSPLAELAANFGPAKARTGRLIDARDTIMSAASREAQSNGMGLPEWMMMAAATDPLSGAAQALVTRAARQRLPTGAAASMYNLAEGLRTGAAASGLARAGTVAREPTAQDLQMLAEWLSQSPNRKRKDTK